MAAASAARAPEPDDYDADADLSVTVTDREGRPHRLPALEGFRLMEVIRDWGLDIKAECGGACACATCHVYVDGAWTDRLPAASDEEVERLDEAFFVTESSRLACQIVLTPEMQGLAVRLAPGTER